MISDTSRTSFAFRAGCAYISALRRKVAWRCLARQQGHDAPAPHTFFHPRDLSKCFDRA